MRIFHSPAGQQYVREAFEQKAGLAIRSSTNLGNAAWQQYVTAGINSCQTNFNLSAFGSVVQHCVATIL